MTREERKELWNKIIDDNIVEIRISDDIEDLFNPEDNEGYVYILVKDSNRYFTSNLDVDFDVDGSLRYFDTSVEMFHFMMWIVRPEVHMNEDVQSKRVVYQNGKWLI